MADYILKKEDHYARIYTGSEYDINAKTIRELRSYLEQILDDLPDDDLEIDEIWCVKTRIRIIIKNDKISE